MNRFFFRGMVVLFAHYFKFQVNQHFLVQVDLGSIIADFLDGVAVDNDLFAVDLKIILIFDGFSNLQVVH